MSITAAFNVRARFEYSSEHADDLRFGVGQIITVTDVEDADWYAGEYVDESATRHEGMFPRNFVEKYEPTAPPRPSRTRNKRNSVAEPATTEPFAAAPPHEAPTDTLDPDYDIEDVAELEAALPLPLAPPLPPPESQPPQPRFTGIADPLRTSSSTVYRAPEALPKSVATPLSPSASLPRSPPPAPSSNIASGGSVTNSFRDRIAAFNKQAAPPLAPFQSAGFGSSGSDFIKKPFVAPPPSRNAFVPQPREVPTTKIYRRDEDPEIRELQADNLDLAEKAGLVPLHLSLDDGSDTPKPTSLKERIALLQKQQLEVAQRHADAAAKKEKSKKPTLHKRVGSMEQIEDGIESESPQSVPVLAETGVRQSTEEHKSLSSSPPRRKLTYKAAHPESIRDGNEADMSGAGDTTEGHDDFTEKDDSDISRPAPHEVLSMQDDSGAAKFEHDEVEKEVQLNREGAEREGREDEDEESDDVDPEVRRKEELRARMARISGMGMPGMFNHLSMPGGAAAAVPARKARKPSQHEVEPHQSVDPAQSMASRAPLVPTVMALPGMFQTMPSKASDVAHSRDSRGPRGPEETHMPPPPPPPTRAPVGQYGHEAESEVDLAEEVADGQPTEVVLRTPVKKPVEHPPISLGRSDPPSFPSEYRPPPPPPRPPPAELRSPRSGSESDDELSERGLDPLVVTETQTRPLKPGSRPLSVQMPIYSPSPAMAPADPAKDEYSSISPTMGYSRPTLSKRHSRPPPPIPGSGLPIPATSMPLSSARLPPPPPPPLPQSSVLPLKRRSTADSRVGLSIPSSMRSGNEDVEITEYEGDYDTDMGSSVLHKEALKSHSRAQSLEEDSRFTSSPEAALSLPVRTIPPSLPRSLPVLLSRSSLPPSLPLSRPPSSHPSLPPFSLPPALPATAGPPRAIPPPIPLVLAPVVDRQRSLDTPRSAPLSFPPVMPAQEGSATRYDDDDFEGHDYSAPRSAMAIGLGSSEYEHGNAGMARGSFSKEWRQSPLLPAAATAATAQSPMVMPVRSSTLRQSLDVQRSGTISRRSVDTGRPSLDSGSIALDIDLAVHSGWWRQNGQVPPVLQGRRDMIFESTESVIKSTNSMQAILVREIRILFLDYSQTILTVRMDMYGAGEPDISQEHEPPPRALRQDQLEQAYERFGIAIAEAVMATKDSVVGDGTAMGLVHELLRPHRDALPPVGTRAFGAMIYSNMANASTQQYDEIRRGDIVSFRNGRFQGKHGPMHGKYSTEVGKPDHVAVVAEWDGTKKKVRAWEQGRDSKKVKMESFKLDDLRSGEVKIWRVMPRSWVGWSLQE